MIMRDKITQIIETYEQDSMGGRRMIGEPVTKDIVCRASYNTTPEAATAYGVNGEKVLYVITSSPLDSDSFYYFEDKKYSLRHSSPNRRFFYSILIEEKE